jgi:hypothetical protein
VQRSFPGLLAELRHQRPDVVVLACTGPVVQVVADALTRMGRRRPVLVSGLPGLCLPASARAWRFRFRVDVLVTHSRREQREFADLGRRLGARGQVALAGLPFLAVEPDVRAQPDARHVVFAAQAKVPPEPDERRAVLVALDRLARQRPDLRPLVKLRALAGEQQTHRELLPYDLLWRDLVTEGRVGEGNVQFAVGPMADHLTRAAGLATVSSTAALEAMAVGVPVLVLGTFGVDDRMLNLAFQGSGLVGQLDDLARGLFRHPHPDWLRDNYFHPQEESDWVPAVQRLVVVRRTQGLPRRPVVAGGPGPRRRRRSRLRLLVPGPVIPLARRAAQLEARGRRILRHTA